MPRPRPTARVVRFDPDHVSPLPPAIAAVLESGDPAITAITRRVVSARVAGEDVQDPDVLARCVAQGRADHAAAELGGVA